jgi:PPOX class probable F420-dependent enzyme
LGNRNPVSDLARSRFSSVSVAVLATVSGDDSPHLVPITFALRGDSIVTGVDHKPKRSTRLRRLDNIAANPAVSVLAHHYDPDDWTRLWWSRADGSAKIVAPDDSEHFHLAALLENAYPQYRDHPIEGPIIAITVERWSTWAGS